MLSDPTVRILISFTILTDIHFLSAPQVSNMSSVTHAYKFGLAAMAGLGAKSSYDSHRKIARTGSAHGGADETGGIPGTLGRRLTRKNTNGSTSSSASFDSFQEEIKRIQRESTKENKSNAEWN